MATIRRRGSRFQVQVRRQGQPIQSRTFLQLKDAQAWARQMEVQADRHDLPSDHRALQRVTLGELVTRYRDTVTVRKRSAEIEQIVLSAFLSHPICSRRLSELRTAVFVAYGGSEGSGCQTWQSKQNGSEGVVHDTAAVNSAFER
jgi:hypothetical protein